jgi:UDP-glucose 4-epimerase
MNILITGSSGYIGSHFTKAFADKYNFVKFSLLQESLDNLQIDKIDIVLHCAALVHQKTAYDYEKYENINVKYPVALAKKAKRAGVKQFVFISTIAVYGEGKETLDEGTECNPLTLYGKSKLAAERELESLNDQDFTVSIVRPPMVYGKNAPGNIASLISLVKKVPVLPFGKIDNERSFVYIDNLIYLIDRIIEKRKDGIFLACDNEPISTTKLIELIAKYQQKRVQLLHIPYFGHLLKILKPSLHKRLYGSLKVDNRWTKTVLGFENRVSTEEGIRKMLEEAQ